MNEQSQLMNQSQIMNQPSQVQIRSQPPPQLINQNPQIRSQSQFVMNPLQAQGMGHSQMMKPSYGMWPSRPNFPNPTMKQQGFVASKPCNWKGKKGNDKRKEGRKRENPVLVGGGSSSGGGGGAVAGGVMGGGGYKPPTLNELQHQNRMKARKFYPKKKFTNRFAPYAPRNTTSFIIRAKKSGGIASLVSPCPVTPAVLPTPIFSPSREVLGDMAKEEWGVDGYGSMKGLIRLRSPGNDGDANEDEEEEEGGSSDSDVEEHVEVERRLDHDLSRFEMVYPNYGVDYNNVLENRVDDQDTHIAQLEEENLILKERLFLMEREFDDLRRRLQCLERQNRAVEDINEEVVENAYRNESEGREDARLKEEDNKEVMGENNEKGGEVDGKEQHSYEAQEIECLRDVCMEESIHEHQVEVAEDQPKD
ncbi:hypothetical protein CEY00_Acc30434 [Actinidia chinensis var. chinensis]|uniref:Uncharacterized protein n=1 Tax=Actinidia chinensis var. chinensis TaxID=1590841 RepID=A0A2R6PFR2_ACTCC|nr:hypothetical protein CEY00_Acc30434 [Actinidia chinensis var. chinensis]